jgi:Tol biopolymer transport system component
MGEVYLAEDLTLGRQVALKVLPPGLAATGRERFEREARAVAALNHPNIVTLHSIDQSGDTPFLTMEFVDGTVLNELIPASGMPLDRLLKIAIPLADAVGAAHQRGILHRDLKPANVMVTADGRVKVLDFGLAKLQDVVSAREPLPTQELTGEGRIVGTIAYMSPEQAEGKVVDQRSDVFSLGVLLYELATGVRPFTGDTGLAVLSAILREAPRPVSELKPELPRDFTRIIRRALNKNPEDRYQSAKDLRNDLTAVLEDLASGEPARSTAAATGPPMARRSRTVTVIAAAAALIAVTVVGWLATRSSSPAPTSAGPPDAWTPVRLTSNGLIRAGGAVSPDGRYIAYAQAGGGGIGLWLRQIATGADINLRPLARVTFRGITFSQDSTFVYYCTFPVGEIVGTLYRVPVIGGAPQKVLYNVDSPVTFSPDGRRIAFVVDHPKEGRSTLDIANADGTGQTALAERKLPDRFLFNPGRPAWAPDGSAIAATVIDGPGQGIVLVNITTGASRLIGDTRWPAVNSVQWLPGGREMIAALRTPGSATSQLWRVDADTGAATAVTRDLFGYTHVSVASESGAIVATAGLGESTLWTADADRLTEPRQITTGAADGEGGAGVSWAADGSIVYTSRASGNNDLWTLDPGTGTRRQLTSDPADDTQPSVSPDGRLIAFVSNRQGGSRIWMMHADGGDPRPLTSGPTSRFPLWRPDSSAILYMAAGIRDVWQVNVDGRGERSLNGQWLLRAGDAGNPLAPRAVSPQGLIAGFAMVAPQSRSHLAFAPLDGSTPLKLLDLTVTQAVIPIDWAPDGKAIDLPNGSDADNLWRYPIDGRPGYRLTTFTGSAVTRSFDWSADGRLVLSRGENKSDLVLFRRTGGR